MGEATSVYSINKLPPAEQERIYGALAPRRVLERFNIDPHTFTDSRGRKLLELHASSGSAAVEIYLRHAYDARDPLLYFHLADTRTNRINVLLAVVNDPESPRFDIDRMPDGSPTNFGVFKRNVAAELAAMRAGLAPGQIKAGLRVLREMLAGFEEFAEERGHDMYYIEPLFYHNAIIFERYGFAYQQGRRWMESIHTRFSTDSPLFARLDGSTPFRQPSAAQSVRGRSWAIHDGILGEPFTGVHMYKRVGEHADVETFPEGAW
ncbi:MAG: hypothetical protein ACE5FI_01105 [Anaerolineales bacterium]